MRSIPFQSITCPRSWDAQRRDDSGRAGGVSPLSGGEDRGLTPPARQFIVSSEVDMDKKFTPTPGSIPSSRTATIPKNSREFLQKE